MNPDPKIADQSAILVANNKFVVDGAPLPVHENMTGLIVAAQPAQLTAVAAQIFGADPNRGYAEFKNLDAVNIVYIGKDNGVTAATGYPIKPGEFWSHRHTGALWGICAATKTAPIGTIDIARS